MSDTTANLALSLMPGGVAEGYVVHNDALIELDAVVQTSVTNRTETSAPAAVAGDRYIVGDPASGTFLNHENHIAYYNGSSWKFYTPKLGWRAWVANEKVTVMWDGTSWKAQNEAVFSAHKSSGGGSQSLSGSFAGVTWNTQSKYNSGGVFTHSTSSNSEQITINETGDYEIQASVTFDATSGTVDPCELRLSVGGSAVDGSTAYTSVGSTAQDKSTIMISRIVSIVSGDILKVEARVTTGGAQALADGCRILVRKVS